MTPGEHEGAPPPDPREDDRARVLAGASAARARDEHWRARRELISWLARWGHDAEVLALLGRVVLEMKDEPQAGRWWLLSSAEGPDVERAVDASIADWRGARRRYLSQLPHRVRKGLPKELPAPARARLQRLGIDPVRLELPSPPAKPVARLERTYGDAVQDTGCVAGCIMLVIAIVTVFVVGLVTVVRWIVG